ncbi:thioredoxin family protein [Saccharopolyspora gloriosae]|uniref:TlpA family protein disulfide reductase n=1 Tax=Saccharopolyspora gloriosae TaxID=455344 RepID=UPI001FB5C7CC|nr:thioredoxin family protein [Saccharopolyspora gloriosae]
MTGWLVLLVVVAATLVFGVVWRSREGRVRPAVTTASHGDGESTGETGKTGEPASVAPDVPDQLPDGLRARLGDLDGTGVTLLQLSSTFCAPCRHTRILLADMAERTEGMRHVEVDLTDHPEWSTPLRVHRTPTTLALDGAGRELFRVGGVPRRDELTAALRVHLP